MFGLGWSELLVVGIVALIVIGPKDLPGLFRTMGQFTGKARMMAREFSRAMEQAADDAGVKDISKTLNAAANPKKFGVDKIKEATGVTETPLSPERQAAKEKMSKAMGDAALARQAREAEEAAAKAAAEAPKPETPAPEAKT
ncbi:sec-independent protein translocase protein TatB [Loktanella sp. PT4BL]|jgi:sec-independent protein translocase protein TatB|uniref:Sec-independent protein translocase protein TatB n=1 Tax=Loktanella sp. PT4BL TaxID=2135611 RepID=UPI000D75A6EC|nr:Sec-independent protein translocase protein TatB [Loktanella sp. PT4BL]PXW70752.1 sec-independent protein translocase protein TatB [Loktanella sp. PT4BL]